MTEIYRMVGERGNKINSKSKQKKTNQSMFLAEEKDEYRLSPVPVPAFFCTVGPHSSICVSLMCLAVIPSG
jgi:hypothetical protein